MCGSLMDTITPNMFDLFCKAKEKNDFHTATVHHLSNTQSLTNLCKLLSASLMFMSPRPSDTETDWNAPLITG